MPSLHRRSFLHAGSLFLSTSLLSTGEIVAACTEATTMRAGLITDLHYADKPAAGSRHYRQTPEKLKAAGQVFRQEKIDQLIELGDLIDAAPSVSDEMSYLEVINDQLTELCGQRRYVLGNHCVDTLKKSEFLDTVGQEASYGSVQLEGAHLIFLDACFRSDGEPYQRRNFEWTDANIPEQELKWLEKDLESADGSVVVFAHQRLDVDNHYGVKNQRAVRRILEKSGKVRAVFQGHSHSNDLKVHNGIPYVTLVAMVEGESLQSNGYSVLRFHSNHSIELTGWEKQKSHRWLQP